MCSYQRHQLVKYLILPVESINNCPKALGNSNITDSVRTSAAFVLTVGTYCMYVLLHATLSSHYSSEGVIKSPSTDLARAPHDGDSEFRIPDFRWAHVMCN